MAGHHGRTVEHAPRGTYGEVIGVAWPIVVSMLSYTSMGLADTFLVAQLGTEPVAGVGIGVTAMFALSAFGWGLMNAVKVVVAQAYGAGKRARTVSAAFQGVALALLVGSIVCLTRPLAPWALSMLGAEGAVRDHAQAYFGVRLWAIVPMYVSIAAFGYFQGLGDTKTPMRVQVVANLVNIGLDYLLIFGAGPIPALGVEGAAIATVVAFSLQGGAAAWLLLRATRGRATFSFEGTRGIVRLGTPMGVRFALEVLSWAFFTGFVARMGAAHVAAHTIAVRVISISFLPGHGIGEAACVLTGQAIGAGDEDAARRVTRAATLICLATMGACGLAFWLWGGPIMGLFRAEREVLHIGSSLLLIAAVFQVFDGVAMVKSGALNGAGDTRFVMIVGVASSWLLLVPAGYALCIAAEMGAPGAWLALTGQILVMAAVFLYRWEARAGHGAGSRRSALGARRSALPGV